MSAPQLTGTNAERARRPRAWISRATSSFPLPVSPSRNTVEAVGAPCSIARRTEGSEPRSEGHGAGLMRAEVLEARDGRAVVGDRFEEHRDRPHPQPGGVVERPVDDEQLVGLAVPGDADHLVLAALEVTIPPRHGFITRHRFPQAAPRQNCAVC